MALVQAAAVSWRDELRSFWQAYHRFQIDCDDRGDAAFQSGFPKKVDKISSDVQLREITIDAFDDVTAKARSQSRSRSRGKTNNMESDGNGSIRPLLSAPMSSSENLEVHADGTTEITKPLLDGRSFTLQRRKTPTSTSFKSWDDVDGRECKNEKKTPHEAWVVKELQKKSKLLLSRGRWDQRPEQVGKEFKEEESLVMQQLILQKSTSDEFVVLKRREAFVGNLPRLLLTSETLAGILLTMFQQLPDLQEKYSDSCQIITDVKMPCHAEGTHAFVTFADAVLCSTAISMHGFHYGGRKVVIRRPVGYKAPSFGEIPPLNVEPLRLLGFLPPKELSLQFVPQSSSSELSAELYFGNLNAKQVDEGVLKALLLPVCERLPEYDPAGGPAIKKISTCSGGSYCFIEFQTEQMALRILPMFDGTSFFGRKIRVKRRSGYMVSCK